MNCILQPWRMGVAMLAFLAAARADIVHLRSGEVVIGKIIVDERTKIVIKSEALGRLEIPRERIERVERDAAPETPPEQPFGPPPPVVSAKPGADVSTDWIQLKSGEWLRGKLHGMQNRTLEFESDELDDLKFDWKDVHQVILPEALVSYGDRETAWGSLRVDRENVTVTGAEEVRFPRYDLIGIAPGTPRELDYWSGRFNVGLNLRAGNTEQADLVTKMKLERRTPRTHLKLEYVGNFSELEGVETVNNHRATEAFDIFLTRRLFVRVPQAEYYRDPFQNIGQRFTVGGGAGYYLIDKPKVEWVLAGGPAYQFIRFDTVPAGETQERSTPAFAFESNVEIELTRQIDLELGYQAIVANEDSGGVTQHGTVTVEIDLTRRLDLDISFVWDRIGHPQADSAGVVPENDDFRLNLSLGVKF